MKIAIATQNVVKGDGQGRVNYEIAWEALRRGHELTLIAGQVAPDLRRHPRVTCALLPPGRWPTQLARDLRFVRHSTRRLARRRHSLDLVHVNGFNTLAAADVNTAHFVHGDWLRSPVHTARVTRGPYAWYQRLYTLLNARWEQGAFHKARVVVAVSDQVRRVLVRSGIPRENIKVIENGVDVEEFAPGPAGRAALGLPEHATVALFVGDIRTPRKNLDTVLRALVTTPGLHLAVAGSTKDSPYPALARRLGLAGRVHFLGYRRDIAALMRAADLFVFPSRYETFGLALLEAMASGLPVITARTVGAAELVSHDCGVVLDNPDDTAGLTDALRTLSTEPARRQQMGCAARVVATRHTWTNMAERYLALYETLAR
jgi:glycosyltransferase involved in cell wall biosynthesis